MRRFKNILAYLIPLLFFAALAWAGSYSTNRNFWYPPFRSTQRLEYENWKGYLDNIDKRLEVNVLAFGADSTGVQDSTTALQAAVDAGASIIDFPPGTYLISSALDIPPKVSLRGHNRIDTTIKATSAIKMIEFDASLHGGADGWDQTISNLMLDGNNTATHGIYMKGTRHLKARDLRIKDCTGYGIQGVINGSTVINVIDLRNIYIENCDYGLHFEDITYSWFTRIWVNSDISQTKGAYFKDFYGLTFEKCYWEGRGVQLVWDSSQGAASSSFDHNYWIESTETGLTIPQSAASIDVNGGWFTASGSTVPNYAIENDGETCNINPTAIGGTYGIAPILLSTNSLGNTIDVRRLAVSQDIVDNGNRNNIVRYRGTNNSTYQLASKFSQIPALADDATPSIKGSRYWTTGGTTTITDFDDGQEGYIIEILSDHAVTIDADAGNIIPPGGVDKTLAVNDYISFIQKSDGKWYCRGYIDNSP